MSELCGRRSSGLRVAGGYGELRGYRCDRTTRDPLTSADHAVAVTALSQPTLPA